ncbi:MAG: hypothetical protein A2289_07645 [Deltaproteobacteria bacterium RIFOXYA12_FULL_58_15]|nr:MAG: hypothetical protein A2289_07645 [Deltaproteobacteria bacterium RIFOXYA12_FULL_58_15]OGR10105.1 MAG: hypothetical protein A2341_21425 [Deltaproteobacteria bacterium RIFOXYB12_FULL_58_9]
MANLQVKNLPEDLNKRLHRFAREQNRTIRDIVLDAVRRELERNAFVERLHQRATTRLRTPAQKMLNAERSDRGMEG